MKTFLKEHIVTLGLLLIVVVLVTMLLTGSSNTVDTAPYESRIKELEQSVLVLDTENKKLLTSEQKMSEEVAAYKDRATQLEVKVQTLKKKTNEILKSIDSYSDDELYRFFADRYRYNKDSIN